MTVPPPADSRGVFAALAVGIAGAILWAVALFGGHVDREVVFRAYLFAYLFPLGISLGSLTLLMLHNLTGGDWGDPLRPALRAAARTLPVVALLFLPIALGLAALYPWARPAEWMASDAWAHRRPYLNPPFFFARAAVCFLLWNVLAFVLTRPRMPGAARPRGLSAAGLVLYLFSITHAGIDWLMSRDEAFYSTTFGFILGVGQTLSALAFVLLLLPPAGPSTGRKRGVFNDLGNVLLTLVILWAYVSFMQFLVIWMGNTREDNGWYLARGLGGGEGAGPWRAVALGLVVLHFFLPFLVLLFRATKQYAPALRGVAGVLLAAHVLEEYWLVAPSGRGGATAVAVAPRFDPHWVDAAAFLAVAGLWLACFLWLRARDPRPSDLPDAPAEGVPAHG
jgi:hypothetical protein